MRLSILILSIPSRAEYLSNILAILSAQKRDNVELLINSNEGSVGKKRNQILKKATGDYVCFVDDDDEIADNYIELIMNALKSNPTHCSLKGVYTFNGQTPEFFEHSNIYTEYKTTNNEIKYERYPNHLNVIRRDLALKATFPDTDFGEDTNWATQLKVIGDLTNEAYIPEVLYYYKYRSNK